MDYLTVLNELVYQDQKTVTYRTLSRHLGVHVNFAKQMLFEFLVTDPPLGVITRAQATYCLTGYRRPDKGKERTPDDAQVDPHAGEVATEFVILLAAADVLESAKASFTTLTGIHVYSVGIGRPKDPDVVTAANVDLAVSENTATAKYGIIKNTKICFVEREKRNDSLAAAPPESKASFAKATTSENNSFLEKPPVHAVPTRSKSSESAASSISASLSKRSTSAGFTRRKTAREPATSGNGSRISETFFGKPRAKTKQAPAKPKILEKDATAESDNDTSGTDEEERDRRLTLESVRAAKEMDDMPLGDVDAQEENEAAQQAARRAEVIAGLEQAENEEAASVEAALAAEQEAHTMDGGVGPKRRIRRKVVKSVTLKTERGYIETRDVEAWESFSEGEGAEVVPQKRAAVADEDDRAKASVSPARKSPTKAKGAATAAGGRKGAEAGKGKKGKGSGGQQASLLMFWKK